MSTKPDNIVKDIVTEQNDSEFQFRFFKDEMVGLLHSRGGASYFILDSADYWYDLIQSRYPAIRKCSCKNDWFRIKFEYVKRTGYDDFKNIIIRLNCTKCGKDKSFAVDINYSGTTTLYENPITFCKQPVIKYKLYDLGGYWTEKSLLDYLAYMCNTLKLNPYCWFWNNKEHKRYFEAADYPQLLKMINNDEYKYISILFAQNEIDLDEMIECVETNGVYLKDDVWRKHELIELNAPITVAAEGFGDYYHISACEEFVFEENIASKSDEFKAATRNMLKWLNDNFDTSRGKNCYNSFDR